MVKTKNDTSETIVGYSGDLVLASDNNSSNVSTFLIEFQPRNGNGFWDTGVPK